MPRDWDLVRAILLALEQLPDFKSTLRPEDLKGYDAPMVSYHLLLLKEAGLVEAVDASTLDWKHTITGLSGSQQYERAVKAIGLRLTWAGHELLDSIRSQPVWQGVKKGAREKGLDLSLDVIVMLAKKVIEALIS